MQDSNETQKILQQIDETIIFSLNDATLKCFFYNKELVHYTSAIIAREIIEKEQLWLRKTLFMNDYSEITYGKQCLENLLNEPGIVVKLNNILKPFNKNLNDLKQLYYKIINDVEKNIYISCLSEHLPEEDTIGRLSMWRAYGNSSGIALVINSKALAKLGRSLTILPVIYSKKNFKINFIKILENIENIIKKNLKNVEQLDKFSTYILSNFSYVMYIYIITLKHQGFWEEREWRIILSLFFLNLDSFTISSKIVEQSIENIKGNPEVIYKLNLNKLSFINPSGESLLKKIIIGPNSNSELLVESFSKILKNKGLDDKQVENMITVSNIPLRY